MAGFAAHATARRAALLCVLSLAAPAFAFVAPSAFVPARSALQVRTSPATSPGLSLGAALASRQTAGRSRVPLMAADKSAPSDGKSVLIFSWFYAAPKELELVRRIYKKKGFTNIVIQESIVKEIATPRGWYRTYDKFVSGDAVNKQLQDSLGQSFDVVHCMSGGFLNLALVLSSGIPVRYKVLVMDSTPIMPQPKAFVRFARAYMMDNGLDVMTKVLPEPVHTWFYTSRWGIGGAYVRLKHKVLQLVGHQSKRRLGDMPYEEMEKWTRWATHVAMLDRYENMTQVTVDTVLSPEVTGVNECIFLYNPEDPYINPADVGMVIDECPNKGVRAVIKHVENKHIETLFRKPNILFNALEESLGRSASSSAAVDVAANL